MADIAMNGLCRWWQSSCSPPEQLFKPAILREVLPHLMTMKWKSMSDESCLFLMAIGVVLPLMISAAVIKAF